MMNVAAAGAFVVSLVACVTDWRTRRIPNALTFSAAGLGLTYHLVTAGLGGLGPALGGLALGLAIFFPLFALRGMGAGDVKLMAAIGAWVGPQSILWVAIYAALAGGVLAVALSVARRYMREALRNLGGLIRYWRVAGIRPMPALTLADARGPRLAYAFPIAIGTVMTLWLA